MRGATDPFSTSGFNEVYFSERRNFEATHKIPTSKNKFGRAGENAWRFRRSRPCEPLNSCSIRFQLRAKRSSGNLRPQSNFRGVFNQANTVSHPEYVLRGNFQLVVSSWGE